MKNTREDRFGINMIRWCRDHERYLEEHLEAGDDPALLLAYHEKKLAWLMHERLIHLLVTMMTSGAFLFTLFVSIYLDWNPGALLIALALLALLAAYLFHYFRLENTVQHWYRIADKLRDAAAFDNKKVTD